MENRYFKDIKRDREIRHTVFLVSVLLLVLITGIRLFHVIRAEDVVKKITSAVVIKSKFVGWSDKVMVEFHIWEPYQPEGGTLLDEGVHRATFKNGKIVKLDDVPLP